MTNYNPTRLGQLNNAGSDRALFLKLYGNETLVVFENQCEMQKRTTVKSVSGGSSVTFPLLGNVEANYHTAGQELLGDVANIAEKIITLDNKLVSRVVIDSLDEKMAHYDSRAPLAKKTGYALASVYDQSLISLAVKACHDTGAGGTGAGAVTGEPNSEFITIGSANTAPTTNEIMDGFAAAAIAFDRKNIPEDERYAVVDPATYNALLKADPLLNSLYSVNAQGSFQDAKLPPVYGIHVFKSNWLAQDYTAVGSKVLAKYQYNTSKSIALVFHKDAIATGKIMDLSTKVQDDPYRLGTMITSVMSVGHGVLRTGGLFSIEKA